MKSEFQGADGTLVLPPQIPDPQWRGAVVATPKTRLRSWEFGGSAAALCALAVLIAAVTGVVLFAAAGSTVVAAHPGHVFPGWEAGPLSGILSKHSAGVGFGKLGLGTTKASKSTDNAMYTVMMVVAFLAYLLVLRTARSLRMWQVSAFVVLTGTILLLGPPDRLNDLFNYLGYARLGALHGLNPYTHVIANEHGDPSYLFATWRNLKSPYGPLFTALTYPLALLPLAVAYWELKIVILALSFGFLYCVYLCAVRLGRDPRWVILFIAANPVYLFFELGGFHNDFVMLLPSMASIALLLGGRERASGVALALAVAVKFTTIVLLPFLLIAAWRSGKWPKVLQGVGIAAIPLAVMDWLLFGLAMPNTRDQSRLVTSMSIPNLAGLALGQGGATHAVVLVCELLAVGVMIFALSTFRRRSWIEGAGWAQIALIASLAWLMPWYVVWALPLVALSRSAALRRTGLVLTAFVAASFVPLMAPFLKSQGFNPQTTAVWRANNAFEQGLQWPTFHTTRIASADDFAGGRAGGSLARRPE